MCIDLKDLNKVDPKNAYQLRGIDKLVYETSRHEMLRFIDDYQAMNPITRWTPTARYFVTKSYPLYWLTREQLMKECLICYSRIQTRILNLNGELYKRGFFAPYHRSVT